MNKIVKVVTRMIFKLKMTYLRIKYRNKTVFNMYPKLYKPGIINYIKYKIHVRKTHKYIKEKYNL